MSNKVNLPDWDEVTELIERIADLTKQDILLDAEYDYEKANEIKAGLRTPGSDGKLPAATSIISTVTGSDKLYEIKKKIAENKKELKRSELRFKIITMQVDLYRTESANIRNANIS